MALFLGSISAEQQVTLFGLVGQQMQRALKADPISLNMRDTKCKKKKKKGVRDHSQPRSGLCTLLKGYETSVSLLAAAYRLHN